MVVQEVSKGQIERGMTCQVCAKAIPASAAYRVTCPHCRQTYVAPK